MGHGEASMTSERHLNSSIQREEMRNVSLLKPEDTKIYQESLGIKVYQFDSKIELKM